MKWTSTKVALPDAPGRYIIYTPHGMGTAAFNKIEKFSSAMLNGNTQYSQIEVTHWMPFPSPPGSFIEINSETHFDQIVHGIQTSLTLRELSALSEGKNISEIAPDWQHRQATGLRIPRPEQLGRSYNGNDMGHDYMYRYKDGRLSADLPLNSQDD
ncbi:DUF551 domain-containing protein [Klebsiella aerogenes]|uniref:DUF551 domain-containing protein n=1 Tax=Klebsiella aerogenes TaxID=548 RepID=UPI001F20F061|nr:DUF551 domain-containing protein [Klebsiella aerogenes]